MHADWARMRSFAEDDGLAITAPETSKKALCGLTQTTTSTGILEETKIGMLALQVPH